MQAVAVPDIAAIVSAVFVRSHVEREDEPVGAVG